MFPFSSPSVDSLSCLTRCCPRPSVTAVSQLEKCLEAANTLLGSSVEPSVFRL